MKTIRYWLLIGCLLFSFPVQAKEGLTVLLFGDSIIAGYGLKKEESIPVKVETLLKEKGKKVAVINGGVSGDTTAGGRKRLEKSLKKYEPNLVVLALGANDMLKGVDPEETRRNLKAMLDVLTGRKLVVVLSAVHDPGLRGHGVAAEFNHIYPELVEEYEVYSYPFLLEKTYGKAALMQPDGVHPNAAGASLIARDLANYLVGE